MTDQEPTEFVRICPNPRCHLVYRPDPAIYKDPHNYCPKCGTDMNLAPYYKRLQNG